MTLATPTFLLSTLLLITLTISAHVCILRDAPDLPPQSLPDHRINDDYCDCDDASDENRTSACPNGFFLCKNEQYRPVKIYSSWVHDGSCDCCDGSDEPAGACPDTCAALRAERLKEATRKAEVVRRGISTRKMYATEAERDSKNEKIELRKLEKQLASVDRQLKSHEKRAQVLRKRRDWEDSIKQAASDESSSSNFDRADSSKDDESDQDDAYDEDGADSFDEQYDYGAAREDEYGDDEHSAGEHEADADEPQGAENEADDAFEDMMDDEHGVDEYSAGEHEADADEPQGAENEADDAIEDMVDDEHEDALDDILENEDEEGAADAGVEDLAAEAVGSNENEGAWPSTTAPDVEEAKNVEPPEAIDIDSLCAELVSSSPNWFVRGVINFGSVLLNRVGRFLPEKVKTAIGRESANLSQCISQAESAKWELDSKKREIEDKIDALKKKIGVDYGADNALRKLHGSCTRGKVTQYEFELCMFDTVRQYENGVSIAQLGQFEGWEGEGKERVMKYSEGDRCWNGPARSIKVELLCSDKEEVVSVDEPNRCTYRMKFKTAAVCEESMLKEIMADFDEGGEHDEKQEL
eukprot:gb/GEZJ01000128.1/.p1 GENE.gb/GEZJ01000128.1/~~gb/GEZJ01000128.1/.p1  ORF type:complete len:584 (+),score=116.48 gb/GEZJ01000128.1/:763-2514(+)